MSKTLVVIENIFEQDSWKTLYCDDICAELMRYFKVWPDGARIYNGQVSVATDITPVNEAEVDKINSYDGPFYVIVSPGELSLTAYAIIAIVAVVAAAVLIPKPKIPTTAIRNSQSPSPNNELSSRSNKARIGARIPDMFGTNRAIPDLLAVPYSIFVNHQERIYDYMCVGRGYYDLDDFRDAQTRIGQIKGAAVEAYDPFHSPNDGVVKFRIGDPINTPVLNVSRSKSVNGQVLFAPNDANDLKSYTNQVVFVYPNIIRSVNTAAPGLPSNAIDFTELHGDLSKKLFVKTANHRNCDGCFMFNFTGEYDKLSVSATEIVLSNPNAVSPSWAQLEFEEASKDDNNGAYGIPGHVVGLGTVDVAGGWVGPFTIDQPDSTGFIANFVALQGMYKDDGSTQVLTFVQIEVEVTPIGVNGLPTRSPASFLTAVIGSDIDKASKAQTLKAETGFTGRMSIRARRRTPKDYISEAQVVDEVKWRDLYSYSPVDKLHFGNVTTVQSVTFATENALSLSERELNARAIRKLPARNVDNTFTTELYPTNNAADIFCAVALDPKIGNRTLAELNVAQIYNTVNEVTSYFGTSKAAEFCYTFDSDNISFEETAAAIADAVYCEAFRRGTAISFSFERTKEIPSLLFGHRNKIPGSEKRTLTFGKNNDNDGVEYQYIAPEDDALITYYIPEDQSAVNPKKVESIGVRNHRQAHFHAWRIYNKMRYQRLLVEFEATQEAFYVQRNDLVLVADNTLQKYRDGEVLSQEGLTLRLSQKHGMESGKTYMICLQHIDATVQFLDIVPGADDWSVTLGDVPLLPLSLEDDASVHALYMIIEDTDEREYLCLIEEREPNDNFTCNMKAINYSPKYYQNDMDYINDVIS